MSLPELATDVRRRRHCAPGRILAVGTLAVLASLATASSARAQYFVSPLIGYDFGSDTGCLNVLNCADRRVNVGLAGGRLFGRIGVEEEVAYTRNFFGRATDLSSYVLTVMTNAVASRRFGRWHPYAVAGIGAMKAHVRFTPASFYATDTSTTAWDLGAGVRLDLSRHWGVRADARYFRSFKEVTLTGFTLSDPRLGFGRAAIGLNVLL